MFLRSTQEGEYSFEKAGAALESLPEMKTEAQASKSLLTNVLFAETELSEAFLGSQTWEDRSTANWPPMVWVSKYQDLEARITKALAWEIQAAEAQHRANQCKPVNGLEVEATQALNQKPLPEVQVAEEEKHEVLFTCPC